MARKIWAGTAVAALSAASLAVAAPSAQAFGPSTDTLYCDVAGISTTVATWNTTWEVTVNGNVAGDTINVGDPLVVAMTYVAGPNNGGPASTGRTKAVEIVDGSNAVVATGDTAWSADAAVPGGGVFPGATLTSANLTAGLGDGTYTARIKNVLFEGYLGATGPLPSGVLGAAVSCNANAGPYTPTYAANNPTNNQVPFGNTAVTVVGPNAAVTSVVGQDPSVTGYVRGGTTTTFAPVTVAVSGTNWSASVASGITTESRALHHV